MKDCGDQLSRHPVRVKRWCHLFYLFIPSKKKKSNHLKTFKNGCAVGVPRSGMTSTSGFQSTRSCLGFLLSLTQYPNRFFYRPWLDSFKFESIKWNYVCPLATVDIVRKHSDSTYQLKPSRSWRRSVSIFFSIVWDDLHFLTVPVEGVPCFKGQYTSFSTFKAAAGRIPMW